MLCSLNATRVETSVGGIACIRTLLQQTETKAAARTLLSLFTRKHGQAWQDTQDKKKWLLVVVSSFCVNHQSMALASFWWDSGHPFPLVSMFPLENFTNDPLLLLIQTVRGDSCIGIYGASESPCGCKWNCNFFIDSMVTEVKRCWQRDLYFFLPLVFLYTSI